jgi:FAD/FMN-containing dehydrogenase
VEPQVISKLEAVVGKTHVLTEPSLVEPYSSDWTDHYSSQPIAVVRVTSREQVAEVLKICNANKINVIPQGGNTGLVGGSVGGDFPHIILSTKTLRNELHFDVATNQVIADAGFTLGEIQKFAEENGLEYNVDLGARDAATIGGTVATNAGGMRVVAHGMTSAHVVGIEMVLPSGEFLSNLGGLPKNNTGFDITKLAIGSEGTLGVITRVRLQFHVPRRTEWTVLLPVDSIKAAIDFCRPRSEQILAAELMETDSINEIAQSKGAPLLSGRTDWWLLIEGDGQTPDLPENAFLALDVSDTSQMWSYRESHTGYINRLPDSIKIDVCVPVDSLSEFIGGVKSLWSKYGEQKDLWIFGHVMDGNLHLAISNCTDPGPVIDEVMELVVRLNGAISAEHGIGRAKTKYLKDVKTPFEIATMKTVKSAFDSAGIMNPGVIFPLEK